MEFIRFFIGEDDKNRVRSLNALATTIQGSVADDVEGLETRVDTLETDVEALQDITPVTIDSVATTSGTSVTITNSVPPGASLIFMPFNAVSTNGTSSPMIQLGVSGTPVTSGYSGGINRHTGAGNNSENHTSGFRFSAAHGATDILHVTAILMHLGSNVWSYSVSGGLSNATNTISGGGTVTLGGELSDIFATTVGGVNTYDAGSIGAIRIEF